MCLVAFIVAVRFEILAVSDLSLTVLTCFAFNAVFGVNGLQIFLKDLREDFNLLTLTSFLSLGKGKDLMLGDMAGDSDGDLRGSIFTMGVFNNDVPSTGFYNTSTYVKIKNTSLCPFLANVTILYPLKTPENLWFSNVFRGYKMETLAKNGQSEAVREQLNPFRADFLGSMLSSIPELLL